MHYPRLKSGRIPEADVSPRLNHAVDHLPPTQPRRKLITPDSSRV